MPTQTDVSQLPAVPNTGRYGFEKTISREVLENYFARAISMEGLFNGRGDLDDNVRMLASIGAKFIGRSLCLWAGEANFLSNLERAKRQVPSVLAADPEMLLQACVFEIVTTQVDTVLVPSWVFTAFDSPAEHRNFQFADMIYPEGQRRDWGSKDASVPDISRLETRMWFYYQATSYIDLGFEAIHFGQVEIMALNDVDYSHWFGLLTMVRDYAARHARRRMVICDGHVPAGGPVQGNRLLLDFHSFPIRIKETPGRPEEAVIEEGYSDSFFGRSNGGITYSGWECDALPYLAEIDNWGVSKHPGEAGTGEFWIWGYDEISWFARQSQAYRAEWLKYGWDRVQEIDPNGYFQMPGSRTVTSPLDGRRWYHANRPGAATPDGLGDEDAIRAIWASDDDLRRNSVL